MKRLLTLLAVWTLVAIPAEGATISVAAGGDLQAAINAAKPGDTILLQAGATFSGNFKLPAKGGTDYITIRSSTPDSQLPPPGVRISPAYAHLLAKVRPHPTYRGSAFLTRPGASYWRLLFLEITPVGADGGANLIDLGAAGSAQTTLSSVPHHLIIDRCYIHGHPTYGQRRGVALNSAQTQIINSHISDIKLVNQDTQAIAGWNGPGPFLIENNYLEGSAENIMFGGSDPSIVNLVPANITIRRNTIAKPLAWRTQSWTVKNHIELKNARDVLVEGNILENNWAAGQTGYSIAISPRNQSGGAPWSVVKNVTFRHNIIRHVAGGFAISGYDDLKPSQQTENIVIRNNLLYDVSTSYGSSGHPAPGRLAIIGNGPRAITFDHNTVDHDGTSTIFFYEGKSPTGWRMYGFELTNNLLRDNRYGLFGQTWGEGSVMLKEYAPDGVFLRNTLAGASASQYPAGNYFPTIAQWLADFISPSSGDYRLRSTSLSNNGATDGTDIGVNFAALDAAMKASTAPPPPASEPEPEPEPPPSGSSTPYSGSPVPLPGTIQAENYDRGGEGVAYHDTTSGNSGSVYRSDRVDLQTASDTGGGYKVKTAVAGEWLRYAVNVTKSGTYTLATRVTSGGTGGRFHIEVDGVDVTGPITVPNTGGWQSWTTVTKTGVPLAAGVRSLRLVLDTNGATGMTGNFNWIKATLTSTTTSTAYLGTPVALPGTIQAENYDRGGEGMAYHDTTAINTTGLYRNDGVDLQVANDTGGGYKVKTAVAGEWLRYAVNVVKSGVYTLSARVASGGSGGRFHVEVDGQDVTGPITVPNTGGWNSWTTVVKTGVSLTQGLRSLRVVLATNGATGMTGNFNWFRVQ